MPEPPAPPLSATPKATVTFVIDTNVLVQCKALTEIDWSLVGAFDEIRLLVTEPVYKEIDNLKGGPGARRADKARTANRLFGQIIERGHAIKLRAAPLVTLDLSHAFPDPTHAATLDYAKPDHRLVGIAAALQAQEPQSDIRVLTGDTGPKLAAHQVGVPFASVHEAWLLPAEDDSRDKRIKALERQVEHLAQRGPQFDISFADEEPVEVDQVVFQPLHPEAVERLMQRLRTEAPEANDFGPVTRPERSPGAASADRLGLSTMARSTLESLHSVYVHMQQANAVSDNQIVAYRIAYAGWLAALLSILVELHAVLNATPRRAALRLSVRNTGSCGAEHVQLSIEASGALRLDVASSDSSDEERLSPADWPLPPDPPRPLREHREEPSLSWLLEPHERLTTSAFDGADIRLFGEDTEHLHWDSNERAGTHVSGSCDRWRHGLAPRAVELGVYANFAAEQRWADGAIRVTINASNMPENSDVTLPVLVRRLDRDSEQSA